ncbi:MAG: phosphoglycerate kinase [Bdellovibrionota bacterium]
MNYPKIQDLDLKGKRVLLRVDFNVPLKESDKGIVVADDTRITAALPTIQFVLEQGGKCLLASHLGRPKGQRNPKYSLEPVGTHLSTLLGKDVILTEDCVGDGPRGLSHNMRPGDVLLLENLRFETGEESNSPVFSQKLAELCDVYINDAFGTMHRAHASTEGITHFVEKKGIGLLVQQELKYLEPLREAPKRPFVLAMGGAKISDKMGVIEHFLPKVDTLLIGGAMAYAFLRARGYEVGKSLCPEEQIPLAQKLMKAADARNVHILLPIDHVVAASFDSEKGELTDGENIPGDKMGLDIGPKTVSLYERPISQAETIFWNGPMGVFEKPAFSEGTFGIARAIGASRAQKLAGGGDCAAAVAASGEEANFDFISTGGGATLEFLEGKNLPGLKALALSKRES